MYDELTINERQRKDKEFSSMLDCVRRGCPTDETLSTLQQRVIQVFVSDKFCELQESDQTPVCLFSTRKACDDLNTEMLTHLTSEVHELVCTDEVDETGSTRKWKKRVAEHLQKKVFNVDSTNRNMGKIIILKEVGSLAPFQRVTVEVKVVHVDDVVEVSRGKKKQDILIGDKSAATRFTVWEHEIGTLK